jgi:hypothetical protein
VYVVHFVKRKFGSSCQEERWSRALGGWRLRDEPR